MSSGIMSKRVRGFTLVEVLVVIGIIALLIALLLPVLGKAKDYAMTIKCESQLQQIGAGVSFYESDNQGYLNPCQYNSHGVWPSQPAATGSTLHQILSAYVSDVDPGNTLWACPSASLATNQFPLTYMCNQGTHPIYGYDNTLYLPNVWQNASGAWQRQLRKINSYERHSEVVQMGDGSLNSGGGNCNPWFDYTDTVWSEMNQVSQANQLMKSVTNWGFNRDNAGGVRYRHSRETVGNCLFLDGHVESFLLFTLVKKNFATGY